MSIYFCVCVYLLLLTVGLYGLNNFLISVDVNAKKLLDIIRQHLKKLANIFDYCFLYMRILEMET